MGKTFLTGPASKEATAKGGRHHNVGPTTHKIPFVKCDGKEPTTRISSKNVRENKNTETDMSKPTKAAGKGKISPTKAREAAKKVEVPIFRTVKNTGAQHVDPMNANTVQQKVIDRPVMFRGRGLHPRTTTPGRTAERFKKSNTNIPFWSGDMATKAAPAEKRDVRDSQRVQGQIRATEKYKPKQVGMFFVADTTNNRTNNNNNVNNASPSTRTQQQPSTTRGAGQDDLFTPDKTTNSALERSATSFAHTYDEKPRELDCLSGSRRGGAPPTMQSISRAGLKVGQAIPDENVSIHRHYGKKLNETASGSPRTINEHAHHGKKPFPEKVQTSVQPRANDIGSPKRTSMMPAPQVLQHSKRFENTRRYNSNLHTGLEPDAKALTSEGYDHARKGKPEYSPTKKNGGKTLQYVFEAPKKEVNKTYRPTAPWATD